MLKAAYIALWVVIASFIVCAACILGLSLFPHLSEGISSLLKLVCVVGLATLIAAVATMIVSLTVHVKMIEEPSLKD